MRSVKYASRLHTYDQTTHSLCQILWFGELFPCHESYLALGLSQRIPFLYSLVIRTREQLVPNVPACRSYSRKLGQQIGQVRKFEFQAVSCMHTQGSHELRVDVATRGLDFQSHSGSTEKQNTILPHKNMQCYTDVKLGEKAAGQENFAQGSFTLFE